MWCEIGVEVLFMVPYSFLLNYFYFLKISVVDKLNFLLLDSIPDISLTRDRQKCKPISIYPSSLLKGTLKYTVTDLDRTLEVI